jgi:hypothetical protein
MFNQHNGSKDMIESKNIAIAHEGGGDKNNKETLYTFTFGEQQEIKFI